jgi:addiction module HigA family antidote
MQSQLECGPRPHVADAKLLCIAQQSRSWILRKIKKTNSHLPVTDGLSAARRDGVIRRSCLEITKSLMATRPPLFSIAGQNETMVTNATHETSFLEQWRAPLWFDRLFHSFNSRATQSAAPGAVSPGRGRAVLGESCLSPSAELQNISHPCARELQLTRSRVNDIVRERRAITASTALRLARFFGTTPQFWMNMQTSYELRKAENQIGPAISKIEPSRKQVV